MYLLLLCVLIFLFSSYFSLIPLMFFLISLFCYLLFYFFPYCIIIFFSTSIYIYLSSLSLNFILLFISSRFKFMDRYSQVSLGCLRSHFWLIQAPHSCNASLIMYHIMYHIMYFRFVVNKEFQRVSKSFKKNHSPPLFGKILATSLNLS